MRLAASVLAAALCGTLAHAGTESATVAIRVRLASAATEQPATCRTVDSDVRVTCALRPRDVTTLDASQQWSSSKSARLGTGSDASWKVGESAGGTAGEGPYGAYATSRVVTYGGIEFVELTLNW